MALPAVMALVLALAVAGSAPAGAQIDTTGACPDTIGSAGFNDLGGLSSKAVDAINCLASYNITKGTSATTFGPNVSVTRSQMALFLIRQLGVHGVSLPSGVSQGFTDIGTLALEARTAINQLAQLGVSKGTSTTTFSPFDVVPRWQMALFVTRLLDEIGVGLPSGLSQGFTDIVVLPGSTQKAINQLAQLDISEGTSTTTYSPFSGVTRGQMALFLTRTLQVGSVVPPPITGGVVTPRPAAPSGAPDLNRVSFSADDEDETKLLYQFDEPVSFTVNAGDVWLVGWNGDLTNPNSIAKSPTNDRAVEAVFFNEDYDNAVAGVVTPGAVFDVDGHDNTTGSYPLRTITLDGLDWPVDYPELVKIGVFDAGDDTVEFEFDQDVDFTPLAADHFHLIEKDGTLWTGADVFSDDGDETLEVKFSGMSTTQFNAVVRAFVEESGVQGTGSGVDNVPMGVDRSNGGRSDTPYLTSIDLTDADDGIVLFDFDQDLVAGSGQFQLVLHDGTVLNSTGATLDPLDADEVKVEFNGGATLPSDLVIYANVLDGAVKAFSDGEPSRLDTLAKKYTFRGYDTAGPDLVSSVGSVEGLSGDTFTIKLTFDEDVEVAFSPATELIGWDADGDLVDISGGTLTIDKKVVEIDFGPGDTGTEELIDGDVVRFGIRGDSVEDLFGFTSYPDGVGCGCAK